MKTQSKKERKNHNIIFKGPFCDSGLLVIFMILFSRYRQNKPISKFPVNSEVVFNWELCTFYCIALVA